MGDALRRRRTVARQGKQTHELSMDVAADGDGALDGLDVGLVDKDFPCLLEVKGEVRKKVEERRRRSEQGVGREVGKVRGVVSTTALLVALPQAQSQDHKGSGEEKEARGYEGGGEEREKTDPIAKALDVKLGELLAVGKVCNPYTTTQTGARANQQPSHFPARRGCDCVEGWARGPSSRGAGWCKRDREAGERVLGLVGWWCMGLTGESEGESRGGEEGEGGPWRWGGDPKDARGRRRRRRGLLPAFSIHSYRVSSLEPEPLGWCSPPARRA